MKRFGDRADEVVSSLLGRPVPRDVPEVDWDAEEARVRAEWRAEKAAVLLRALDPKYRNATPRHELSSRWLAAYRAGRFVNLGIFGPTGVGKTWEAAAIARLLLEGDFTPVLMVRVPELMDKLRPGDDAVDIGMYLATPVLVLDDLGAETDSAFTAERLYRIADYRHNKNLPTIVTSNLRPGDPPPGADRARWLELRYNDRLLRRLFEGAAQLVISDLPAGLPPARFGAVL